MTDAGAELTIDLDAIAANWHILCSQHPSGQVGAVVKADGYGLGAGPVASRLHREGCRHFFVAQLAEAHAIRNAVPGAMLGVLNGLTPGTEDDYIARDLVPVLGSLREIACWQAQARTQGQVLTAILHIDTGMSRLGLDAAELRSVQRDPGLLAGIALRYVMTHLASSERRGDPKNDLQQRLFTDACAHLRPAPRSIANSSGIFLGPRFGSDLARPGAALYGINPTPGLVNPMRPVARLRARILQVRNLPEGATVGYNATWAATRPSRIATASIGYADGWMRSLSGRGAAIFDERVVPLVGRVSMDLSTFDVTDCPGAVPGAWLDLIGPGQTVDAVADAAGTNGYEVLTSLGRRFGRTYLGS